MGKKGEAALGRSVVNAHRKLAKARKKAAGEEDTGQDEEEEVTTTENMKNMDSVTEETSLEEFLARAQLAGTKFTAEHAVSSSIVSSSDNKLVGVMSASELRSVKELQAKYEHKVKIPRRPPPRLWNSADELHAAENEMFLDWRRQLAEVQEVNGLLLTPFERNIELWRQFWRVLERSDVVVQIVDARNPLLFRNQDLESYVKELDATKENLLLVNKADILTVGQRQIWAEHFEELGIRAAFWCALPETENQLAQEEHNQSGQLLSCEKLIALFKSLRPDVRERPVVVGMVGYPNVGKSSTVNRLLGVKKVSVSATPGKTRHLQTLCLDSELTLCDCPGLVMPSFALSKAEMLIEGILPADQMQDCVSPVQLLCNRMPSHVFQNIYGLTLPGDDELNARELLTALAFMRGFMSANGIPDVSRAGRLLVKDVVGGKVRWCAAPPGMEQNRFDQYPTINSDAKKNTSVMDQLEKRNLLSSKPTERQIDDRFFDRGQLAAHHKGKILAGGRTADGEENGGKPWKKHNNKHKKEKLRRLYRHLDA